MATEGRTQGGADVREEASFVRICRRLSPFSPLDGAVRDVGEKKTKVESFLQPFPLRHDLSTGDYEDAMRDLFEPLGIVLHGGGADAGVALPLDWLDEAGGGVF